MAGYRGKSKGGKKGNEPCVNRQIKASEVRLMGEDGHQYGVVSIQEALRIGDDVGLDVVEVSPSAKPPVAKLIDYGKFKYQKQKKASEAKKKQSTVQVKEVQFRPNIEQHDLDVKLKKVEQFLTQGDKVKMIMQFRGREMAHSHIGLAKFKEVLETACGYGGEKESEPKMMGNRSIVILAPTKNK